MFELEFRKKLFSVFKVTASRDIVFSAIYWVLVENIRK